MMQHKDTEFTDFKLASSDSEIIEKVGHFIDELCAHARTVHVCMRCGSALR
jgi:hypothetical protein